MSKLKGRIAAMKALRFQDVQLQSINAYGEVEGDVWGL
jgi:hypothetical protein